MQYALYKRKLQKACKSFKHRERILFKRREERERERGWQLEQPTWCFGVSLKEAYQCTTWRLSGGHITATAAALCISWKMFLLLIIKGIIFRSPRNIHGQFVVPCPYQLPNPLLNLLFSLACQTEIIEKMTNFFRGLTWLGTEKLFYISVSLFLKTMLWEMSAPVSSSTFNPVHSAKFYVYIVFYYFFL